MTQKLFFCLQNPRSARTENSKSHMSDNPLLEGQPPLKKMKCYTRPSSREERPEHKCVRTNFVRISEFLQWYELLPLKPIINKTDHPYLMDPYLLAIHGNTFVLDLNLTVRKCKINHSSLAEAAALGDRHYVFFYLFRKFQFFPSFELILKIARMGATNCLEFVLKLYPVADERILASCAASRNVEHFRIIFERLRPLGIHLSHQCVVEAIRSGSLDMLSHLMALDCPHKPKLTAMTAAEYGTVDCVRYLMSRRVTFVPMCYTVAVLRKRDVIIELLIEYGVVPHRSAIHAVLMKGDLNTLNKFIDGAKIHLKDEYVVAACACRQGKHDKVLERLVRLGVRFPEKYEKSSQALLLKTYFDNFVKKLLL